MRCTLQVVKTCKEEYIGETLRAVRVRCKLKEHQNAIRLGATLQNQRWPNMFIVGWENVRVIDYAKRKGERKIQEEMQIQKRKPQMNRDKVECAYFVRIA